MKPNVLRAAIAASILSSSHAYAGDADIFVFLEQNPLQGIEVTINGDPIGKTDEEGATSTYLDSNGKQELSVVQDGKTIAVSKFDLKNEQDVEVSIVLSEKNKPVIHVFKTGEDQAKKAIGYLKGQIKDQNGNPVSGATVSLSNTDKTFLTGADGNYSFDLPRGDYNVTVTHDSYEEKTFYDIRIVANIGKAAIITLREKGSAPISSTLHIAPPVEEVLIMGTFPASSDSTFQVEQMSTAVVDAIDMEQIIRFGDTNVASALKRVVGVSIVDGKYAVVRGLDGRYISSTLNGNLMPTTNPFKRDAELDLFPSDILSGIEIQKSFSADLPADSTAGTILVKTQGIPEEYKNTFSISLGYNSSVTGKEIYTYEGGDTDFWGYDDGTRALPSDVYNQTNSGLDLSICQAPGQTNCINQDEASRLATLLPNTWEPTTTTADPNFSVGYSLGGVKEFSAGSWGTYGSLSFDKNYTSRLDAFESHPLGVDASYTEDSIETALNAYLVTGFESNGGNKIESKTIFIRGSQNKVRLYDGFDNKEGNNFTTNTLEWREREVLGEYLSGLLYVAETHELNWRLGFTQTTSDVPDRRTYTYFGNFLSFSTVERSFLELTENAFDAGLDYSFPLQITDAISSEIKTGLLYNAKDRENEIVRIGIRQGRNPIDMNANMETLLTAENFNNDAFRLNTTTDDTDRYSADQETTAAYISTETSYEEKITFVAGVRQETFNQEFEQPNVQNEPIDPLETDALYPSLSFIYRPTDKWQFKLGYSETISRPTLTERAPTAFYDEKGDKWFGNPELNSSDILNFDFRIDYYFGDQSNISLALFNKQIDQPVEVSICDCSGSSSGAKTWRNEKEATLDGIEIDINTHLFDTESLYGFIGANVTFIQSEVSLEDDSARLQFDSTRELQGQSPFLANIQIGVDHLPSNQKFTFLINHFDDRIYEVRRKPEHVVYEAARTTLDFNYTLDIGDSSSLKLKAKNITNEGVTFTQKGKDIEGWKTGTRVSLGYSYRF